jgi:hypothetical protein
MKSGSGIFIIATGVAILFSSHLGTLEDTPTKPDALPKAKQEALPALPPGFRAYVVFPSSVEYMNPLERVDVLLTRQLDGDNTESRFLLRNVLILPADIHYSREFLDREGCFRVGVVLALRPDECMLLARCSREGQINIVKHGDNTK